VLPSAPRGDRPAVTRLCSTSSPEALLRRLVASALGLALLGSALSGLPAHAAPAAVRGLRQKQAMRTQKLEIQSPAGLAYSAQADRFIVLPAPRGGARSESQGNASLMDKWGDGAGTFALPVPPSRAQAAACDERGRRLLVLDVANRSLYAIPADAGGRFDVSQTMRLQAPRVGLVRPAGMAVDPVSGEIFVLDHLTRRIMRFTPPVSDASPEAQTSIPVARWIPLGALTPLDLRGLAFEPTRRHLVTLDATGHVVYELAVDGRQVASYDVSTSALVDPQAMVFAPSGDQTDDPTTLSLFVADAGSPAGGGGRVVELATAAATEDVSMTEATSIPATLVRTTQTSKFSPPSPDPSGITYDSARGRLVIDDGEVDEMGIYQGKQVFETSLAGTLLRSYNVLSFCNEPVGTAFNPNNQHLFISDDDHDTVWDIDPRGDGLVGTSDDTRRSFSTRSYGSGDAEGLSYDRVNNRIFIADGVNEEIYIVRPGSNGVFDGGGDDQVTHFDTHVIGVTDPETVEYKEDTGTLFVISSTGTYVLKEVTTTGTVLAQVDLSSFPLHKAAGMCYAPTSNNPSGRSVYIVNRGVDNNSNPSENDGTLVEIAVGGSSPPSNAAPFVSAGSDQIIALTAGASLNGTVTDDGLPNPPGAVTTTWSKASGPGSVSFQNANAVDTQASFTTTGTYVLTLTANDSQMSSSAQVQITVQDSPPPGTNIVDRRIASGTDDAEESATGSVGLTSSDLELVFDGSNQTVGLRFPNLTIAQGATISTAYVQFEADEAQSEATTLTIRGQAVDNAAAFTSTSGDVSTRGRTSASVTWTPAAWGVVGEVGASQRTPELKTLIQQIVNRSGWASGNALALIITGSGHRTARAYDGSAVGAALLHIEVGGPPPANTAPTVNAGVDQTIALSASAALDGTVGDDGLPSPPSLTTTWSMASGPGSVSFQNANAVDTQASFTTIGTYVLRLTANDGALSTTDQVQVTVQSAPSNTAPVVSAGPDLAIALPSAVVLDGTVTDDGQPSPPALSTTWSKVSGPGSVSFQDSNAVDTQASFTTAGTYVLSLTANDGALSTRDQVQVLVDPVGVSDRRIAAGTDDAEENASGHVSLNSNDIELIYDKSAQTVGLRFTSLTIPRGATITNATIQFRADEVQSEVTNLSVRGQAAGNAATFSGSSGDVSTRSRTAASVAWSPTAWSVTGEAGANQRTPDLAAVIQEIVNRSDWSVGNALVIIVTGTGHRTAEAFEGMPTGAALLHVQYQ
jgi:K319-like protein/SdiA-regulated protein